MLKTPAPKSFSETRPIAKGSLQLTQSGVDQVVTNVGGAFVELRFTGCLLG
jgi:hypothetical protein